MKIWLLINGFFTITLIGGVIFGNDAAMKFSIFIAWMCIVATTVSLSPQIKDGMINVERSMPESTDIAFDLFVTAMIIFGGWPITAGFYFIHMILQKSLHDDLEKMRNERDAVATLDEEITLMKSKQHRCYSITLL